MIHTEKLKANPDEITDPINVGDKIWVNNGAEYILLKVVNVPTKNIGRPVFTGAIGPVGDTVEEATGNQEIDDTVGPVGTVEATEPSEAIGTVEATGPSGDAEDTGVSDYFVGSVMRELPL